MTDAIRRGGCTSALVLALFVGACAPGVDSTANGSCDMTTALACALDLVSFSCAGGQRPDQNPTFGQGVQGIVCTDQGQLDDSHEGYCCTAGTTSCAYEPNAVCAAATYGYSCLGTNRPDAYDPTLSCGQGIASGGLIVYCCGPSTTATCTKDTNVSCASGTTGFECTGPGLPNEGELGIDESRSDAPLLCTVPTSMNNGVIAYCCFTPTDEPVDSTCLQDQGVAGCASGSYGFACTGTDTPDEDYPRMTCPQGGGRGVDENGVSATLFCCTYTQP